MDLALNLGKTLGEMNDLTEVELGLWTRYASRKMLPWRRMELYLAQVSRTIASVIGGSSKATLADFMFDPEDTSAAGEEDPVAFFGFNPRQQSPEQEM